MAPALPPSQSPDSFSRTAVLENLEAFQRHLAAYAQRCGLVARRAEMLCLAFEEIFVNICHYGYPQGPGSVLLKCACAGEDLTVDIIDEGVPFDPTLLAIPDLAADIESRAIGGLGWFLVRQIADDIQYSRQDGRNVVRLLLHRQSLA